MFHTFSRCYWCSVRNVPIIGHTMIKMTWKKTFLAIILSFGSVFVMISYYCGIDFCLAQPAVYKPDYGLPKTDFDAYRQGMFPANTFSRGDLNCFYNFEFDKDVMVFLRIQKTGGTTFGNPDNGKVKIESKFDGENCLQMTTESGYRGQLNDYYCKRKLPFVCKNKRMYTITTTPFIQTSTTQQSSGKSSRPGKSGNSETPVIVICLLVSLLLISVIMTVILILRRRRNNLAMANVYEDMADPSPNENLYTGLAGTSGDDNGANIAVRPPIKTPPVNQSLQENYSEPYLYDRTTENSVSESQKTGQNNSSVKPGKCLPYKQIHVDCSKSTDGNPSKPEVQIRQNKGVKGQQFVTSPSGYIDMNRHYEEIVDDHEISSKPGSLTVKDNLVKKGNGKEAYTVDKKELPLYYLTPKSEAQHQKAKK